MIGLNHRNERSGDWDGRRRATQDMIHTPFSAFEDVMAHQNPFLRLWQVLREMTGETAYERYLKHWREHHADNDAEPLSRKAFYAREQDRKWNGVKRCC